MSCQCAAQDLVAGEADRLPLGELRRASAYAGRSPVPSLMTMHASRSRRPPACPGRRPRPSRTMGPGLIAQGHHGRPRLGAPAPGDWGLTVARRLRKKLTRRRGPRAIRGADRPPGATCPGRRASTRASGSARANVEGRCRDCAATPPPGLVVRAAGLTASAGRHRQGRTRSTRCRR